MLISENAPLRIVSSTTALTLACKAIILEIHYSSYQEEQYFPLVFNYVKNATKFVKRYQLTMENDHCIMCCRKLLEQQLILTLALKELVYIFSKVDSSQKTNFLKGVEEAYTVLHVIFINLKHAVQSIKTESQMDARFLEGKNGYGLPECVKQPKPEEYENFETVTKSLETIEGKCNQLAYYYNRNGPVSPKELCVDAHFFKNIKNMFIKKVHRYRDSSEQIEVIIDVFQYVNQWLSHSLEVQREIESGGY